MIEVPEAERPHAPAAPQPASPSRPPLKIGIVSPYGFPHPGGVNEHVRHAYEELRSLGHDPWIITPKYGRERDSDGHVIRVGTGWAVPSNGSVGRLTIGWRLRPRLSDLLAAHRFDILHFHEPFVPFLGPAVLTESETVNIGTFHAFGGFSPSYWLGRHAAARLAARLHGRIAVSGAARHFIDRYFPASYRIIPNGVEIEPFATAEPFEELRDGTLNILFVGRLEDRKGLSYLLRGFHRLRKRHVDARLIVVGSGPKLREYRRYVATRRIRDVEFVGHVPLEAKLRYYASADIFCAPSTGQESFGIVLLEAMAAGLPIVASDIHGYKNVVTRNQEGFLVEPRNPTAIAAALYKLAGDPDLRHRMGDAGRAKAPEYSWERVTQQVVAYYYEVRDRVAAGQPT
jgi:phosphatidylinositol alpha-mannosyltransferase